MSFSSALVLLSGGLDSATLLARTVARAEGRVEALFVNYGQRHIRERDSARSIAAFYQVPWLELDLTGYGMSVTSALTTPGMGVPWGHYTAESMAVTVVPNRNAVLLSAAAGIAATRDLDAVLTAVHSGDHAVYADCRPAFVELIAATCFEACGVHVEAPFVGMTKAEIVKLADELKVPLAVTWSCYEGGAASGGVHCGRCGTCVERAESFFLAGVVDPTYYADTEFWRGECGVPSA